MPNINETSEIAKKVLPIIYVVDTSGSMSGDKIAKVNEALKDAADVLRDKVSDNPDAEIRVGVLTFSSGVQWTLGERGLVKVEDYFHNNLDAGGLTDLGAALDELNKKLSRSTLLNSDIGYNAPVLIFMSDGEPTDDWEKKFNKIVAENKWFKKSIKIAIAIGDDANKNVLAQVVGNKEAVISCDDTDILKKLIVRVSVSASTIGSKSHTTQNQNAAVSAIIDSAVSDVDSGADVQVGGDDITVDPPIDTDTTPEDTSGQIDNSDW